MVRVIEEILSQVERNFIMELILESSHDAVAAMFDGIVINLGSNQASGIF